MSNENSRPWQTKEMRPTQEGTTEIPDRLKNLPDASGEFLDRGVFFDVYDLNIPETEDNKKFVFKDFRSGDATMSPQEQVALFQHQYYEAQQLQQIMGDDFFPESHWIRSKQFTDDQAHGFYTKPGKTANTMLEFIKVQIDRQLTDRYSSDDKKKSAVKKMMSEVGKRVLPQHQEKPFIGGVVQEKINGVNFAKIFQTLDTTDPNYPTLRENVKKLIQGLRNYHDDNRYAAFTWHGLGSDNVMVETDPAGKITGRVFIVDANFTERPNQPFRQSVHKKIEANVFEPLEKAFDI